MLKLKMPSQVIIVTSVVLVAAFSIGFLISKKTRDDVSLSLLPLTESSQTYYLENATEKQKIERMYFVSLYSDGTAVLATPVISSYILPKCSYSVVDDKLLIHAIIETEFDGEFFKVRNGEIIARFAIVDNKTLVFQSSTVPIFADINARYVYRPSSTASISVC